METVKKPVTIYDIVKETNLSASTVSRIINQKGKYSVDTIKKVNEAIEKLGYIPNTKARHLATGSTDTIAVTIPYSSYNSVNEFSFYNMFIIGVIDCLKKYNYNLLLYNNPIIYDMNSQEVPTFNRSDFEGIIFPARNTGIMNYIPQLLTSGIPFVYAGDCYDISLKGHNIYGGYYLYAREVLQIFFDKGYRSIVMFYSFSNDFEYHRMKNLVEEFQTVHEKDNFRCSLSLYPPNDTFQFCTLIDGFLNSENPPDGLFITDSYSCITAYNHLQQAGYRIPEDIAIISTSFSETTGSEFSPTLSTIYVNAYEMGSRATDLLFNQIKPEQKKEIDNYIPFRYINRKSTC